MKWILYIVITVFLEKGGPLQHEVKLSFDKKENCVEMKKVFDFGVSFVQLAQKYNLKYDGKCKNIVSLQSSQSIKERSM